MDVDVDEKVDVDIIDIDVIGRREGGTGRVVGWGLI